jgi:RNA methyltransferase, TrmH family
MVDTNSFDYPQLDVEATLAQAQKLHQNRSYRDASKLFYLEGVRNFISAVDSSATCQTSARMHSGKTVAGCAKGDQQLDIVTILFSEKLLTAPIARKLVRRSRRAGVPTLNITPEQFRRISHTERASGIAAIARQPWTKLSTVSPELGLCWTALETVRSAGNLGTLIRTSEAVGGAGFMLIGDRIDPFDPDVIRASMSGIFSQRFVRTSFSALTKWLGQHHCQMIGASPDGEKDLHQFEYPPATLLFLGEERQGLTPQQRDLCQDLVRIPMVGRADSLNLGVAGSLLLYEVYRSQTHNRETG